MRWIHQNVIKDRSIWELKQKQNHTWIIKKILKVRHFAYQWVNLFPGNGHNCKFWSDPWCPFAPLIDYIGINGPCQTGISMSSSLASLWHGGLWHIPSARSQRFENILIHLSTVILTNSADSLQWVIGGRPHAKFCSSLIYNCIRDARPLVRWHKIIWFKRDIPKHKMLTWLVLLNRCPTRDRLISWTLLLMLKFKKNVVSLNE